MPLLEAADVAVVVPGAEGPHSVFAEALAAGRFQLACAEHAVGWAQALRQMLRN